MRTIRSKGIGWAFLASLVTATLLAMPAVPAAADHDPPPGSHDPAGAGTLEGSELVEDQTGFPCFRMTRSLFSLWGVGAYEGRTSGGAPVVFRGEVADGQRLFGNGPLRVQIENTETYYHGPFGTHGTETGGGAGCSPATVGSPIPAEFRVFAAETATDTDGDQDVDILGGQAWVYRLDGTGQKVPCRAQGTFSRGTPGSPVFGDPTWEAEWTLEADCTVVGNATGTAGTGTAPRGTFHTQHGDHGPCFSAPCTDNFQVGFSQFLPKPGPFLSLGGPGTASTTCEDPVTVTARLTVTGSPQSGVPVTFTVAGPAPPAPPAGAAITGADGKAGFSFTAGVPGDYTITAEATYDGQLRRATHIVRFVERPPIELTLTGPATDQSDDPITVTATATNACAGPVPGVSVHFSVAAANPPPSPWLVPGTASPASGDAITGQEANKTGLVGAAHFTFTGDRAGDYIVTATTSPSGALASDTHTVRLDIGTMRREGAIDGTDPAPPPTPILGPQPAASLTAAVRDPAGRFAYFGTENGLVTKVDLATFQRVGSLAVVDPGGTPIGTELFAAVMDPAGRYAYFVTHYSGSGFVWRGAVVKVDLNSADSPSGFKQVDFLTLAIGETTPRTIVIDPAGTSAYVATDELFTQAGDGSTWLVKVDLANFQRVGALRLESGGSRLLPESAVMDPAGRYAYVGTLHASDARARIVRVDLNTFQAAGDIGLTQDLELYAKSAVIDPAGRFAYFGTYGRGKPAARVVRIDLQAFERVGAIELPPDEGATGDDRQAAVIDPAGDFAYFGGLTTATARGKKITKIDLRSFTRFQALTLSPDPVEKNFVSAVVDPAGEYAYFGTDSRTPPNADGTRARDKIVKVRIKRPANPALAAATDSYTTPYATSLTVPARGVLANDHDTADNDPLVALGASDPAGGSVVLTPDGAFTYTPDPGFAGTDTFTYAASDGKDYSPRATVSVTVAPPAGLRGSALGYYSNVSLFGGPYGERGPAPTVTLAPDGSNSPQDAHVNDAEAVYGPATLFKSGAIDVHAEGAMGTRPGVKTSATVQGHPDPAQRPGPLLYDGLASTCSADTSQSAASVSVLNGVVETKYDAASQEPIAFHQVPVNPPPGYTVEGTIDHVGDHFRIVFNEQVPNADGSLTVSAAHMYLLGPTAVGDVFIAKSVCGVPPTIASHKAVADFDGDGATDVSVFRPGDGTWYAQGSAQANYGVSGDIAVPADYDGDGKSDVAVFRPSNGVWYLKGSAGVDTATAFGAGGDIPVPADYDGDGKADMAVFRDGVWYLKGSAGVETAVAFGASGDIPVPADYDGDGTADPAVFRDGVWYVKGSAGVDFAVAFGTAGDIAVPGDYDGDGTAEVAVFRPSTGVWFVQGGAATAWGTSGDIPVPGDYDGDGALEIAVFRPSNGVWFVQGGPTTAWGATGDVALPLPAAVYRSMG